MCKCYIAYCCVYVFVCLIAWESTAHVCSSLCTFVIWVYTHTHTHKHTHAYTQLLHTCTQTKYTSAQNIQCSKVWGNRKLIAHVCLFYTVFHPIELLDKAMVKAASFSLYIPYKHKHHFISHRNTDPIPVSCKHQKMIYRFWQHQPNTPYTKA